MPRSKPRLPSPALAPTFGAIVSGMNTRKVVNSSGPVALLAIWLGCGGLSPRVAAEAAPTDSPLPYETTVKPFFETHCLSCHGEKQKADLDLRLYESAADVQSHRDVFRLVLQNIENRTMPPENKPQPDPSERDAVVGWLRLELARVDCTKPDPGRVTLRRLNRVEYNNTIRDLVGVDFEPAADFPMDDIGYGFDNIGDVLSMPPILFEKYLAAAERIMDAAIVTGPPPLPTQRAEGAKMQGGQRGQDGWRSLPSQGEITADFHLGKPGAYRLRAALTAQQAGGENARAALRLDDATKGEFEVTARFDTLQVVEIEVQLDEGRHRFGAAFLNDYYNPEAANPEDRDRNLHVGWLEIAGPIPAEPSPLPETHRRVFVAKPADDSAFARTETARMLIGRFAQRAFRRPVTQTEVDRLTTLFEQAAADGASFEAAVRVALEAVLISPRFLFRLEAQPNPGDPAEVQALDEPALASRLSYFLWSTMPDAELLRLAGEGRLRANLDAQVHRMLADPKAQALVENFAGQWLELRRLRVVEPDSGVFPTFSPDLREAMRRETELFFAHIMREDRSVLEFLEADYTFANAALARHYGLPMAESAGFRKVSLNGTGRGGLLTQASFLTITSNPTRTSPVKRGKWVLENILGTPPPEPPANVPPLDNQEKLTGTLRERMEQHRVDPLCASCHQRMDPIGFGFENFDGIGAWRDTDAGAPVDPSGRLVSGETFAGADELRQILLTAKRGEFLQCVAGKMLTYAIGRGLEHYDQCALDEIVNSQESADHRFSSLVLGVVHSAPFQLRRGDPTPTTPPDTKLASSR